MRKKPIGGKGSNQYGSKGKPVARGGSDRGSSKKGLRDLAGDSGVTFGDCYHVFEGVPDSDTLDQVLNRDLGDITSIKVDAEPNSQGWKLTQVDVEILDPEKYMGGTHAIKATYGHPDANDDWMAEMAEGHVAGEQYDVYENGRITYYDTLSGFGGSAGVESPRDALDSALGGNDDFGLGFHLTGQGDDAVAEPDRMVGLNHPTMMLLNEKIAVNVKGGEDVEVDLSVMSPIGRAVGALWVDEGRDHRMYEVASGTNRDALKGQTGVAVASKAIRSGLNRAIKLGALPGVEKVSVRSDSFSGGSSIDVSVKFEEGYNPYLMPGEPGAKVTENLFGDLIVERHFEEDEVGSTNGERRTMKREAAETLQAIESLHSSFNFDGSETMIDYHNVAFYGRVWVADSTTLRLEQISAAERFIVEG